MRHVLLYTHLFHPIRQTLCLRHDSLICVTCVWHDSFTHPIRQTLRVRHDSITCVTRLIYICGMTRLLLTDIWGASHLRTGCFSFNVSYSSCWGHSLINTLKLHAPPPFHQADPIRETWLTPMYDMTQLCVWHDSFICERHNLYIEACVAVHTPHQFYQKDPMTETWLTHMCDMTHL